jgi:hypothetical protein
MLPKPTTLIFLRNMKTGHLCGYLVYDPIREQWWPSRLLLRLRLNSSRTRRNNHRQHKIGIR